MGYATEYISEKLKKTRESRGLSQRALSLKSGVPQGHISKIENGSVDLRLSSLVAIMRALELELVLVPRKYLSVVNSIVGNIDGRRDGGPPRPVYTLDEEGE